jgi:hypothetical protein
MEEGHNKIHMSEVDETIQQQVGNIMTQPRGTECPESLAMDNYLAQGDGGLL